MTYQNVLRTLLMNCRRNSKNTRGIKTKVGNNLTHSEKIALRQLRKHKEIIIKPCNKGGGICVITTLQYKTEVMKHLSNGEHYQKIDSDTTPQIARKIQTIINKYVSKGLLSQETVKCIIPEKY